MTTLIGFRCTRRKAFSREVLMSSKLLLGTLKIATVICFITCSIQLLASNKSALDFSRYAGCCFLGRAKGVVETNTLPSPRQGLRVALVAFAETTDEHPGLTVPASKLSIEYIHGMSTCGVHWLIP